MFAFYPIKIKHQPLLRYDITAAIFFLLLQAPFILSMIFFQGYQNALKVVYSQSKTPMNIRGTTRYIPHAPDRILDAPEIVDDYCMYSFSFI